MTIANKAADSPQSSIASIIKSLKPGDRVRVTREQTVFEVHTTSSVVVSEIGPNIRLDDPTITSIEVIERPLQVGDRVITNSGKFRGRLTAIGEASCLILLDGDQYESCFVTSDLRRAS